MSMFKIEIVAANPKHEEIETPPVEALVDTGSELSWLPADILTRAGITPRRTKIFQTADGTRIEREIGYAIIKADGYETTDELVLRRRVI